MTAVVLYEVFVSVPNGEFLKIKKEKNTKSIRYEFHSHKKYKRRKWVTSKYVPNIFIKKFGRMIDQITWNEFLNSQNIFSQTLFDII